MTGVVLGRFQPLHKGHQLIIDKSLKECSKVVILISSSQESRTYKNPLTFLERKKLIELVYPNITILPLKDLGVGNNCLWGDYIVNFLKEHNVDMDAFYTGEEERRLNWFDNYNKPNFKIVSLSKKEVNISASLIRDMIISSNYDELSKYVDSRIISDLLSYRDIFIESNENKASKSI